MRTLYLVLALLTVPAPAAADPFTDAFEIFQHAQNGEEKEVEPAIAAFEALARAEPRQPLYAAYLGSAMTLRGRVTLIPWNKIKYAEQGLEHIGRALEMLKPEHDRELLRGVPVGLETKFTAARTFLELPDGIFHRRAQGRKMIAELQKHPALAGSPAGFRTAVEGAAADLAREEGSVR
jgi:hypothetical protein